MRFQADTKEFWSSLVILVDRILQKICIIIINLDTGGHNAQLNNVSTASPCPVGTKIMEKYDPMAQAASYHACTDDGYYGTLIISHPPLLSHLLRCCPDHPLFPLVFHRRPRHHTCPVPPPQPLH